MELRVAGDGDVKIIAVLLPDVAHEIDPVFETTFNCFPVVLPCRRVAAQGEDIATA